MADSTPSTVAVINPDAALQDSFMRFCAVGVPGATVMTGKNFSKLCKDAGVLDGKKVTPTDVDLEYSRRVPKGHRMDMKIFKLALASLAEKGGVSPELVYDKVKAAIPELNGVTKMCNIAGVARLQGEKTRGLMITHSTGMSGRKDIATIGGYNGAVTYASVH